jgi:hypothetical protein
MTDRERKRLKKKFIDRWENEGGRVCDVAPIAAADDAPSAAEVAARRGVRLPHLGNVHSRVHPAA